MTFPINPTDAVHVYSDAQRLWLQLRRDIPTQHDVGRPSFKTALSLTPTQAIALAGELLTAATQHQNCTSATKPHPPTAKPASPPKAKLQPPAGPKKQPAVGLISPNANR